MFAALLQVLDPEVDQFDTEGLSDDGTALDRVGTIPDPLGLTDDVTTVITHLVTLDDTCGLSDTGVSVTDTGPSGVSPTDTEGLTDQISLLRIITINDGEGLSDSGNELDRLLQLDDTAPLTDSATPQLGGGTGSHFSVTVTDSTGITDANESLARALTINDPQGISDLGSSLLHEETQTDSAGSTDALTFGHVIIVQLNDTFFFTDNPLFAGNSFLVQIDDNVALDDSDLFKGLASYFMVQITETEMPLYPTNRIDLVGTPEPFSLIKLDGTWRAMRNISPEDEARAEALYRGGYEQQIAPEDALEIIAAGFPVTVVERPA